MLRVVRARREIRGFVLVGNYAASASSGTDLVVAKLDGSRNVAWQQRISYDDGATAAYAAGAVASSDGVAIAATAQTETTRHGDPVQARSCRQLPVEAELPPHARPTIACR